MSESDDKPISVSRRQPMKRRQRQRQVPPREPKKLIKQKPPGNPTKETTALVRIPPNNNALTNNALTSKVNSSQTGINPVRKRSKTPGKIPPLKPGNTKLTTVRVQKKGIPKVQKRYSSKTRLKPIAKTILYGVRLVIVGVGIGAIIGTLLSVLDPANRLPKVSLLSNSPHLNESPSPAQPNSPPPATTTNLYLSQEITSLKTSLQNLAAEHGNLTPGVFLLDLDNGGYIDINGSTSFAAASTIKVPILIAFFQDVDAGKIHLDEMLTMEQGMITGGSGSLQYKPAGSKFSAMELVTKMITISDNTAANMLIAKLGGKDVLNQRFRSWGLVTTAIRNPLPDLTGTNTTSPKELGSMIAMINQGGFVSMRSRDLMLDILRRTQRDNLLPSGVGSEAQVYHKTGDIGTLLADAGLICLPTGKRYVAAVMVKRPNNDPSAENLISSISRVSYQHFSQASTTMTNLPPNNTNTANNQQPIQQAPIQQPIQQAPIQQPIQQQPIQQPIQQPPVQQAPIQQPIQQQPIQQAPIQPIVAPIVPDQTNLSVPPMNTYQPPVLPPTQYYPPQYPPVYPQQYPQ